MKTIKSGLKKYAQGMLGILLIKLCVIIIIMINQACETEETPHQKDIREDFLTALRLSSNKIEKIKPDKLVVGQSSLVNKTLENFGDIEELEEETIICTKESIAEENPETDTDTNISLVDFINIVLNPKDSVGVGLTENCYTFENDDVIQALSPAVIEAKNYLTHKRVESFRY